MATSVLPAELVPIGFRGATVSNTARALSWTSFTDGSSTGIPTGASHALVFVEGTAGTNDVRWSCSGIIPTASLGNLQQAGKAPIPLCGVASILGFQLIRTSSDAVVTIEYFKAGFGFGAQQ